MKTNGCYKKYTYNYEKQKDLGVTFDTKPTFEEHICQMINKAINDNNN